MSPKRRRGRRASSLLAVMAIAALTAPAAAQDAQPAEKTAAFNFKNAPPKVVLSALEELFGVQFAVETTLQDRLTLASSGKVNAEQMVALLDAALRPQGAAARREGQVVRIVPVSLAAARVEMIVLKHADPKEVAQV